MKIEFTDYEMKQAIAAASVRFLPKDVETVTVELFYNPEKEEFSATVEFDEYKSENKSSRITD